MILTHLTTAAKTLTINDYPPVFVYDGKGMDNYQMDKVPTWSINVPFIEDEIRFDSFHERRYNLRISMHVLSEIDQSSEFYQAKFNQLSGQQKALLIALDKIKDSEGRRLVTVRSDVPIKTMYAAQTTNFDMPSTALYFNIPILLNQYGSIC